MTTENTELVLAKLENAQLALEKKQAEFAQYLDVLKEHEENVKALKDELYGRMKETGIKKLETNHFTVTATWDYKRHTYDMKALQALNPQLYKQVDEMVGQDTPVRGSVKISTKKTKEVK